MQPFHCTDLTFESYTSGSTYFHHVNDRRHVLEFRLFIICIHHKYCDSFHDLKRREMMMVKRKKREQCKKGNNEEEIQKKKKTV